jgi:Alcohol dehydrogenase GroES-like domain
VGVALPGSSSVFAGFRFPREVISVGVRWYLRYGLSYRDVEELLAERGVTVDHVTIYRWIQRFTPESSGVCHTDATVRDQWFDTPLPAVLGHEGAGIVQAVGAGVTRVEPGAHVVLSFASCASCAYCLTGRPGYCTDF